MGLGLGGEEWPLGGGTNGGAARAPRQEFWCHYAQAWAAVKRVWGLDSIDAERQALREMLATC